MALDLMIKQSGAVGLRNLGNTCFMNSTLACLGHSPSLTDYFLEDRYLAEVNRDNPLGWKGKVAEEYGLMTKEVWSDKYTTVAPKKFKDALGQFAPRFSGYQQQDSSELLSFLLDGLHEDLNRIIKKPSTPAVESKGRPDSVVADESWVNYKRRNDSIIVDLMQGQLKSRLECPQAKCGRVSITFDPFMFLSAPLPTIVDKVQEVVLVSATSGRPLTIYGCTVSTHGRVGDLRKALSDVSGIPVRRLVIAELWSGRVYRFMDDDIGLNEIRPNEHIYAYEVVQMDELKGDAVCVQVINQKMEKNPSYDPSWPASREFISELFGLPRVFCVPRRAQITNKQLRALVAQTMAPTHAAGETPYKISSLHSDARNCLKCGYTSTCAGCETPDDDAAFDMGDRDAKAAFALQWTNAGAYNSELDKAVRDKTADISVIKRESTIDLGDCLRSFTKQETLSESDPWYCSDCKEFRQAYKKFDIWSLPSLLVIHLKRFQYTRTWRDKLSTFVDFPVEGLDMGQFCVNPEFKGEKGIYDLYGVSNHMGNMGGGHYTGMSIVQALLCCLCILVNSSSW
jgi:ubiquitin C-terminal hydrolase